MNDAVHVPDHVLVFRIYLLMSAATSRASPRSCSRARSSRTARSAASGGPSAARGDRRGATPAAPLLPRAGGDGARGRRGPHAAARGHAEQRVLAAARGRERELRDGVVAQPRGEALLDDLLTMRGGAAFDAAKTSSARASRCPSWYSNTARARPPRSCASSRAEPQHGAACAAPTTRPRRRGVSALEGAARRRQRRRSLDAAARASSPRRRTTTARPPSRRGRAEGAQVPRSSDAPSGQACRSTGRRDDLRGRGARRRRRRSRARRAAYRPGDPR